MDSELWTCDVSLLLLFYGLLLQFVVLEYIFFNREETMPYTSGGGQAGTCGLDVANMERVGWLRGYGSNTNNWCIFVIF